MDENNKKDDIGYSDNEFIKNIEYQIDILKSDKDKLERNGLILACAGLIISFLFTLVTCSRSATKSLEAIKDLIGAESVADLLSHENFRGSYAFIIVIIGIIVALIGGFMAYSSKRAGEYGMQAKITFIIVIITLVVSLVPNITIWAYNNALNNATGKAVKEIVQEQPDKWK